MIKQSILIKVKDVLKTNSPILDYIINRLSNAGAPIKRKSHTKVGLSDDDFEITGNIKCSHLPNGDLFYEWTSKEVKDINNDEI